MAVVDHLLGDAGAVVVLLGHRRRRELAETLRAVHSYDDPVHLRLSRNGLQPH